MTNRSDSFKVISPNGRNEMHQIIETGMNGRRVEIATAPTFEEAKAKVEAMGAAFMEDDADFPECADAYLNDGRVIAIQPEGFTVKDPGTWAEQNIPKGMKLAADRRDALASFDAEFGIK